MTTMISILNQIGQAGGTIEVLDADLRLRVPKELLTTADKEILVEHRDDLIRLLTQHDDSDPWEEAEEPIPCSTCGSLMAWWDFTNRRHCMICKPIDRALQLIDDAARLRRKNPISQTNKET